MKWRPIDWIVLLIIISITSALLLFMLKPYITGQPNGAATTQLAAELLGALIAIVAVYVGSTANRLFNQDNDKKQ